MQPAHLERTISMPQATRVRRLLPFTGLYYSAAETLRLVFYSTTYFILYQVRRTFFPHRENTQAKTLKSFLLRMGPLYMKMGQVLATQTGFFSKADTDEFRSLFSNLPAQRQSDLRRTLATAFPKGVASYFSELDWEPIAAGSVAQVHRARLSNGCAVALKVVKYGVRQRLQSSSTVLLAMLRLLHYAFRPLRKFDLPKHFLELKPLLIDQCDMLGEMRNLIEVRQNFRGHPYVMIPSPIMELSTPDVLAMDFMEGVAGHEFTEADIPVAQIAERLQSAYYTMVYFHGLFHLDPHPGNFLIQQSGKIVLLDLGLVGRLAEEDKWALSGFYYACARQEWDLAVTRFASAFIESGKHLLTASPAFKDEMLAILKRHFEQEASRWSTMSFFDDANNALRRVGSRLSTRFSLLAISLLTGEGFISQLHPEIDLWKNARRFTDRYSPFIGQETRSRFDEYFSRTIPKTIARKHDAGRVLVAPTHFDRYVLPSAYPLIVAQAEGARIDDVDGNSYIDLSCGYGPHILGYAHPCVTDALTAAASRGAVNALGNEYEIALAELMVEPFPNAAKVVFSNSGTEAALMAFRLARAFTGKNRIAKFEGHYHGFSDQGMVSSWFQFGGEKSRPRAMRGSPGSQASVVNETVVLQYGEPESLDTLRRHAREIAGVIVEPMPSAQAAYDVEYLSELRRLCTAENIVLIFDEVVTGFRVHFGGAQHLIGIYPDLTCLGKIIGGGLPCGAVVGRPEIIDVAKTTTDPFKDIEMRTFVGGTLSGNSLSCAAGLATLRHLKENLCIYDDLKRKSEWLVEHLTAIAKEHRVPHHITGHRSIFSITFDYAKPKLIRERLSGSNFRANVALSYYMRKHGVYVPELHTMMLSAAHTDEDLRHVVEAFDRTIHEMTSDGFFTL